MSKLQKKPSALKRGHPTLQNMNFYKFLSTFVGHFCPPGSRSGSIGPIEYGSNLDPDPDPKPWLRRQVFPRPLSSSLLTWQNSFSKKSIWIDVTLRLSIQSKIISSLNIHRPLYRRLKWCTVEDRIRELCGRKSATYWRRLYNCVPGFTMPVALLRSLNKELPRTCTYIIASFYSTIKSRRWNGAHCR